MTLQPFPSFIGLSGSEKDGWEAPQLPPGTVTKAAGNSEGRIKPATGKEKESADPSPPSSGLALGFLASSL